MRKARPLALVGAGAVSRSFLAQLPAVAEHLGPVKSVSYRLASRIANAMRAGYPVADYPDLDRVQIVLISMPCRSLSRTVSELAEAAVSWRGKTVILCDANEDRGALALLAAKGAATASLMPLEGFDGKRLLIEGDRVALAAARRLLGGGEIRFVEIRERSKAAYLAGIRFLTTLSAPMFSAANDCFRSAGLGSKLAAQIIENLGERTLRSYLSAGRKVRPHSEENSELAALERISPDLAASYADALRVAARSARRGKVRAATVS